MNASYTLEKLKIDTDVFGEGVALKTLDRDGLSSSVRTSVSYDTRDNRLFPSSGQFHVFSFEISDEALGADSDLSFKRLQLFARYYHRLPLSLVLKLNASFGYVFGGGDQGVPISERFAPGGIFSVRGFEIRGLGPTRQVTTTGDPSSATREFTIGGDKEAVFNVELEFDIIKAAGIKGVLFADAGNAFDDNENFFEPQKAFLSTSGKEVSTPLGLFYSVGFGFRWFSPIGPLRFEWGIPITKRSPEDRGILFEFTIGNFF